MTIDHARTIYELLCLAAWADGRLDPAETRIADALAGEVPGLAAEAPALAAAAKARLDELGLDEALVRAAARLDDQQHRELAFLLCARLVEADGAIAQPEFGVLLKLRRLFALADDRVSALLTLAQT